MQESQSQPKSDAELFWYIVCNATGVMSPWKDLQHAEQTAIIQALNTILRVLYK